MPGTVYLFGKLKQNAATAKTMKANDGGKSSSSCCLVLKNIDRQVYFLKRDSSSVDELKLEVEHFLTRRGVTEFKCKVIYTILFYFQIK